MNRALATALFSIFCPPTAIALFALVLLVKRSPIGWEDDDGFHIGRPPQDRPHAR